MQKSMAKVLNAKKASIRFDPSKRSPTKNFTTKLPRTTLGTGLARTGNKEHEHEHVHVHVLHMHMHMHMHMHNAHAHMHMHMCMSMC